MRLFCWSMILCSSVLAWPALPVASCLATQSSRVFSSVPSSFAQSLMVFSGSISLDFL